MKRFLALVFLLSGSANAIGQTASNEDLIRKYKSQVESTREITDCGHAFDGPAYVVKQAENNTLDRLLVLTEKQKAEIGKQNYVQLQKNNKFLKKHKDLAKLNEIFKKLLSRTQGSKTTFSLHLIESKEITAFTTIGGYVYVSTGLLDFIRSYDELAFILGHEIGHQLNRHMERKILKISMVSRFLSFADMESFTKMATDVNNVVRAPFDQMDEYEADKYGFEIAKSCGYDPQRFSDFFIRMEKYENTKIIDKLKSTHPFSKNRRACLENYLSKK
ncbi:M48 family metallopeptidase [Poritiphilus flavus]|uniref:M48 family metalloprotease n=1 Tax=Poritiphilus flavus TaxID=2697053 RepID=A0A6L9EIJ1_9FLAO|nr:M48 family metallopeptidase [Poritiphilus flavus]NAS14328.1 M48 family metalloprotease [Poritiphilus flavus]